MFRTTDSSTEMDWVGDQKLVQEQQLNDESCKQLAESFKKSIKPAKETVIKEKGLRNLVSVSEPLDRAMQQLAETIDGIDTNIGGQLDERPAVETKPVSTSRNRKFTCTLVFAADISIVVLLSLTFGFSFMIFFIHFS